MYLPLVNTPLDILPLSPTSEYSSDGSFYSSSLLMAHQQHQQHTPSPPIDGVRSAFAVDGKSVLTWPGAQYYPTIPLPQDSSDSHFTRLSSAYDNVYSRSNAQGNATNTLPSNNLTSNHYRLSTDSYGDFAYSPPQPAPPSSATHGSLPSIALTSSLPNPRSYASTYSPSYEMFPHQTPNPHVQSVLNARASHNNSADYSSTATPPTALILPGGLRHEESSYDPEHAQTASPHTYALPSLNVLLGGAESGPTRNARTRQHVAPYYHTRRTSLATDKLDGGASSSRAAPILPAAGSPVSSPIAPLASPSRRQRPKKTSLSTHNQGTEHRLMEKNYVCTTCDARFARNHDLTRHHKVHDPVKQYRCSGCDRSFTRKDALKRHSTQKRCGDTDWMAKPASTAPKSRKRAATTTSTPGTSPTIAYQAPPAESGGHYASRSNSQYAVHPVGVSSSSSALEGGSSQSQHHYPTRQTRHPVQSRSIDGYATYSSQGHH